MSFEVWAASGGVQMGPDCRGDGHMRIDDKGRV